MMDENRVVSQNICSLEMLILNLIPIKEETEAQLLRALSNTSLQVDRMFLMLSSHTSKNMPASHLGKFYVVFVGIQKRKSDGMITTRTPVKRLECGGVNYWEELFVIMEWTKIRAISTMCTCRGAQVELYHRYGIPKYKRNRKLFDIHRRRVLDRKVPLVRNMGNHIMAPHSRHMGVRREGIEKHPELVALAESPEVGIFLVADRAGKQIFVQGHPEYDRMTLSGEYHQDLAKGISPGIPCNYYENNDPSTVPVLRWRNAASMLYTNWLGFYVYQETPYNLDEG